MHKRSLLALHLHHQPRWTWLCALTRVKDCDLFRLFQNKDFRLPLHQCGLCVCLSVMIKLSFHPPSQNVCPCPHGMSNAAVGQKQLTSWTLRTRTMTLLTGKDEKKDSSWARDRSAVILITISIIHCHKCSRRNGLQGGLMISQLKSFG